MLTGDLNVIDVQWIIQYRIEDPIRYLFQVRNGFIRPSGALKNISANHFGIGTYLYLRLARQYIFC
jgi:regulator of protease activity HflC (stomatin/prohibitin superfamily)